MTARISLVPGKTGAHRAPLQKTKAGLCKVAAEERDLFKLSRSPDFQEPCASCKRAAIAAAMA